MLPPRALRSPANWPLNGPPTLQLKMSQSTRTTIELRRGRTRPTIWLRRMSSRSQRPHDLFGCCDCRPGKVGRKCAITERDPVGVIPATRDESILRSSSLSRSGECRRGVVRNWTASDAPTVGRTRHESRHVAMEVPQGQGFSQFRPSHSYRVGRGGMSVAAAPAPPTQFRRYPTLTAIQQAKATRAASTTTGHTGRPCWGKLGPGWSSFPGPFRDVGTVAQAPRWARRRPVDGRHPDPFRDGPTWRPQHRVRGIRCRFGAGMGSSWASGSG